MLFTRILTALLLLPASIAGILYLDLVMFTAVLAIIFLIAASEWCKIASLSQIGKVIFFVGMIIAQIGLWLCLDNEVLTSAVMLLSSIFWLFAFYQVGTYPVSAGFWSKRESIRIILGFLVLIPSWLALVLLKSSALVISPEMTLQGGALILSLMLIVWGADTGAYFSGRKWGRKKLLVQVSPGKTKEGAWGAIIVTCSIFAVIAQVLIQSISFTFLITLTVAIIVIFSIVGDLYESMFKRQSGIKDSGNILPGHGGILDRIDSLTAAAPIFYLLTFLLGQ